MRRLVVLALAGAFTIAGCSTIDPLEPPALNGAADFSTYVALGTSLADGVESAGSVDRHQVYSYAHLFARQAGARFDRNVIGGDGLSLDGTTAVWRIISLSPLVVGPQGRTPGSPLNTGFPGDFHNLGVPGALLVDFADTSLYGRPGNAHFPIVQRGRGSLARIVARLRPTFVSFEYGANELIGPMTSAGSGTPVISSGQFAGLLHVSLDTLAAVAPNAKVAIFNVPDATLTPFAATFPPVARDTLGNPALLIGPGGTPIGTGGRVLLSAGQLLAQGHGFPTNTRSYVSGVLGTGQPLPDAVVLTASEVNSLKAAQAGYNAAIASEAAARGAALVDLAGVFQQAATTGLTSHGRTFTAAYMTGGLFSLDGVHPTDQGYGFLANVLIDAVNAKFGSNVPRVDIGQITSTNSSRMAPAMPRGPVYPIIQDAQAAYARLFPLPPESGR